MGPTRHNGGDGRTRGIKVDRTPEGSIDDDSFRRVDAGLAVLPWNPFRIDFEAIGAAAWPWPDDDSSLQKLIPGALLQAFNEVVVLPFLSTPDQPPGYVLPGRSLVEELEGLEVTDAIVLPLVPDDGEWTVLLSPAMWVECGSNVWIWGEVTVGHG